MQILGPIAVKFAVDKAGETGLNITEDDIVRQSSASDVMYAELPQIPVNAPVSRILEIFSEHDALCYPVVYPDGKLAGIISIDDIKNTFMAAELSDFLLAHDIMKAPDAVCSTSDTAEDARTKLRKLGIDYLPVFNAGSGDFAGIIDERGMQIFFSRKMAELNRKTEELG